MQLIYTVKSHEYVTLKEVLRSYFKMSERLMLKLKRLDKIKVNNETSHLNKIINIGDNITCDFDYDEDNSNVVSSPIPLDIIYEDEAYLIINKQVGIPVHPSIEHYTDSLSNGVKNYFDKINLHKKIRPVNRIDKNTSGIVIFAKNEYVQESLIKQMKANNFIKEYLAIANGIITEKNGTINAPIARKEHSIIERSIASNGGTSITHFEVISTNVKDNYSIVKCLLETGRTHQIRVHFSHIGFPLLGDTLYGTSSTLIDRQALHSHFVQFVHPISNKKVSYTAPLPNDMQILISKNCV